MRWVGEDVREQGVGWGEGRALGVNAEEFGLDCKGGSWTVDWDFPSLQFKAQQSGLEKLTVEQGAGRPRLRPSSAMNLPSVFPSVKWGFLRALSFGD